MFRSPFGAGGLGFCILHFALCTFGQVGWYVNTNAGVSSLSGTLPTPALVNGIWMGNPPLSALAPSGWCVVTAYQLPSSNYTATAWTFSNSAPASVGIYVASQVNNSSNILSQWTPTLMTNVAIYVTLLSKYIPGNITNVYNAVVTPTLAWNWVGGEELTNSANFSLSNTLDVIQAEAQAQFLIAAPGNVGGTTASFRWDLYQVWKTNGTPQ
jgi:hypothetical protein